ncbi:CcdB family protein [Shimia sp. R10_1]|uniref:CcdB family protein n=1 Tax=Shimia sp. R10_1 TaxID=2821095 RepID=UPI001AD9A13B|nr:CcdB family protein [Shimia sp. R10_1]MBO9475511.1 CcdB family protein [Shimia sp. R10_1]
MAQFDVYRLNGAPNDGVCDGQLVVDLQTDLLGLDATRIVAPLREAEKYAHLPLIAPVVAFEGREWLVRVPELAAVPGAALCGSLGSLRAYEQDLKQALDILINGI